MFAEYFYDLNNFAVFSQTARPKDTVATQDAISYLSGSVLLLINANNQPYSMRVCFFH